MVQGRYRNWRLALPILLLSFSLISPVMGASVSLVPRSGAPYGITIANKFGTLTVTNTQTMNTFTDYANGTIFFDLRGWERNQISYQYLARSFGNGTFDLRFLTAGQQPKVTAVQATGLSFSSGNVQTVDYTTNQLSDVLILAFVGTASQQLFNAAVYGSFFVGIIITCIGVLYAVTLFTRIRQGFDVITGRRTPGPLISPIQVTIVSLLIIIGFGLMIVITVFFGNVLKGVGS